MLCCRLLFWCLLAGNASINVLYNSSMFFAAETTSGDKELPLRNPVVSAIVDFAFKQIDEELRSNLVGVGRRLDGDERNTTIQFKNFACRTSTTITDYDAATRSRAVTIIGNPTTTRGKTTVVLRPDEQNNKFVTATLDVIDNAGWVRYETERFELNDTMRLEIVAPESVLGELATYHLRSLVFLPDVLREEPLQIICDPHASWIIGSNGA